MTRISTIAVAALALGTLTPLAANADTPAIPTPDGLSAITAAASCWEVKVNTPSAPSGVYWLYTAALGAPQQFYCDQTTDGGGWVLIGRGRDGWSTSDEGSGSPADVSSTISGPAAFVPRQLSAKIVNGLLNNTAVSSLPDGVRLVRSMNTAGTATQEVRFTFGTPRNDWSWMFDDLQSVANWAFNSSAGGTATGTGFTTEGFGGGSGLNEVHTVVSNGYGWTTGFAFGPNVTGGSTDANNYWYQSGTGLVRPFTQMYLRPKLMSSDVTSTIPDSGTAAVTQSKLASSFALPTVEGVNGLGASGTGIENTEVSAFAETGGRVFVAGNFDHVQTSAAGAGLVHQSYLAAFDVKTALYSPSFTPTFNDQVKAVAVLPNGDLAVGGDFTQVDGVAHNGFAIINSTTGALDTSYTTALSNLLSSSNGQAVVRALDVQGNWLYIGGNFTHASGGTNPGLVYSRNAVRVSVTDGTPDNTWDPQFDGTVISLDASPLGDRAYFVGYFANDGTQSAVRVAAIPTNSNTIIPWTVNFTSPGNAAYQQAVKEVGNRVWLGGSEHMVYSYNRSDMSQASTNIMSREGGDGQALATDGTNVYAGCHCYYGVYQGATPANGDWRVPAGWTRVSKIDSTGAWDATTGAYESDFSPTFYTREGAGTWALFTDSTGVTWMGGDFTAAAKNSTSMEWTGGFARFASRDSSAPSTPTGLTATTTSSGVALGWSASSDDSGSVTYQVMRNNRVVATTTALSVTLPAAPSGTKYFVRAADPSGNLSASTAAVTAVTPPVSTAVTVIAKGSVWSYSFPSTAPASTWTSATYDDSTWSTGAAPIGFGGSNDATVLTSSASTKPITSYYRTKVTVTNPSSLGTVTINALADDGLVVYVNGTEVGRANMATGTVTNTTYATKAPSAAAAAASPVTFTVPSSAFVTGSNEITAEVHSNYRATPSDTFDLSAVGDGVPTTPVATAPATPPAGPPASGTVVIPAASNWAYYHSATAVDPTWSTNGFNASGWSTGAGPLGWGSGPITTQIATPTASLATYFRSSFSLASGVPSTGLTLTTRADDGVIVFVNGTEVGRTNLPTGTITAATYATAAPSTTSAVANPVTYTVPSSLLTAGTNVITAEVQSNYKSTPTVSFDLTAVVK